MSTSIAIRHKYSHVSSISNRPKANEEYNNGTVFSRGNIILIWNIIYSLLKLNQSFWNN